MSLTVEFDAGGADDSPLARFSWTKAVVAWADEAGPLVRDALKVAAPVGKAQPGSNQRPGRLRDSIRYERETSLGEGLVTLMWAAYVPYANYVLDGTRPHLISATAARALRWVGAGGDMFATYVHHPGTKANPFNVRAVTPLIPELQAQFEAAVEEAMEGL